MSQKLMKRNTYTKAIGSFIAVFMLAAVLPVFAQDAVTTTPPTVPPHHRRQIDPEKVKQFMQKIDEVKHEKLRTVLNLDDATAQKFFAEYDPAEKDLIGLVKQRQEQELKLLQLTRGDYKDGDVDPTMQSIKALNQQISDRYEKLDNNLKSVLTPCQRARLLVFEKEFNRRVREKIREKRQDRRANHPGKHPLHGNGQPRPGVH